MFYNLLSTSQSFSFWCISGLWPSQVSCFSFSSVVYFSLSCCSFCWPKLSQSISSKPVSCWFFFVSLGKTRKLEGAGGIGKFEVFNFLWSFSSFYRENLVGFWTDSLRKNGATPNTAAPKRLSLSCQGTQSPEICQSSVYGFRASAPREWSGFPSLRIHLSLQISGWYFTLQPYFSDGPENFVDFQVFQLFLVVRWKR